MQRPLEILDPGDRIVIQKQLPLSGGNTACVLGSRDPGHTQLIGRIVQ